MWVRNAWYVAGWSEEIAAGALTARTIIEQPLVFYRTRDGAPVALQDRCCHRLAPLSKGRCEGDDLRCMYHGMKFAPDGRCVEIPGQPNIPAKARVRTFPVAERGGWVWVWMGDAALADTTLIPQTVGLDDPDWIVEKGRIDYAADYQLIDDNLLDLTHLAFVHPETLARGMTTWGEVRPRIRRMDRGLRVERWLRDQAAPGHLRPHGERLDFWSTYDFLVPGVFVQRTAWYPLGSADAAKDEAPDTPPIFLRVDDQAVTPITRDTSSYAYVVGAERSAASPGLLRKMFAIAEVAFQEDKEIIEAQQRVIDLEPDQPMVTITSDAGPTLFRRIVEDLVAAEGEAARLAG